MGKLGAVLIVASFTAMVLPSATAHLDPNASPSDRLSVHLVSLETTYESERWKLFPGYYASGPASGIQNGTGGYDGAVGLRLRLRVQLVSDTGGAPSDTDLCNVNLTAQISTPQGPLLGFVSRDSATPNPISRCVQSDSRMFNINFDLDGNNYEAPGAKAFPGLSPGVYDADVSIFYRGLPGSQLDRGSATLRFSYTTPRQEIVIGGFGTAPFLHDVPDTIFRLYSDIGWGSNVRFVNRAVDPAQNVSVTYDFGIPNAKVRWFALAAERLCQPNSCPAGQPSSGVEIHRKVLATGTTDAVGSVRFAAAGSDLLQYGQRSFSSALVVVAAQLEPEEDLPSPLTDEYRHGSASIRAGATEFVIPVTRNHVNVSGFSIDTSRYEASPDPAKAAAADANTLIVHVFDDSGSAFGGDVVAVDVSRGRAPYTRGTVAPHEDPVFYQKYRKGRLQTAAILDQNDGHYRVYAFLYTSPDQFHGFAFADRGYRATLWSPEQIIGRPGQVLLNLTSLNTNYDTVVTRDFTLRILGKFSSPNLNIDRNQVIELAEGAVHQVQVPVQADREGEARITFTATTGDIVHSTAATVIFRKPPEKKTLADQIPGFEAVAFVAALGIALSLWRRRGEGY